MTGTIEQATRLVGNLLSMQRRFRPPTRPDRDAILRVFGDQPTEEQLWAAGGDPWKAVRFRRVLARSLVTDAALARMTVAEDGAAGVVGFVQWGAETGQGVGLTLAWGVLRVFGPLGIRGFLKRDALRSRVAIPAPEEAFHIAELHVLASQRGQGVGAALLEEAEREAVRQGATVLSLTTATNNPARRLYERAGFSVLEQRTDPAYEAATGVAGRVLMTKSITPVRATRTTTPD